MGKASYVFYFGGRSVAQLAVSTGGVLYLMTDHLDTPIVASDEAGGVEWEGGFEPFGADYSGASTIGVFLRFPGQWQTQTWSGSSLETGIAYNLYRWYELGTGRYNRVDPLGILRANELAHLYNFSKSNPLSFYDPFGLDALTNNPDVQDCFYCLLKKGGFGFSNLEAAAWVTEDVNGVIGCVASGWQRKQGKAAWPAGTPFPQDSKAFTHTHPTRLRSRPSQPEPSQNDRKAANTVGWPVYTISPEGVWKYDPGTGMITQELTSGWTAGLKKRCNGRCPQILQ